MPGIVVRPKHGEKFRALFICIVLGIVTFVAFEGVRNCDFVNYDDDLHVTNNEHIKGGLSFESAWWALTAWRQEYWHPLTSMSHLADVTIFGMKPAGHHLVSAGFHIANVILLFLILKTMTGELWPSALVAALFGLHPLAVESAAWVAERKNVLSTFFAFLTIWAYSRYAQKPGVRRYLLVAALFIAGLASKPMLVTLPFVLILLDYWPIGRFENLNGRRWFWRAIIDKSPLLAISAVICVLTYFAQLNAGVMSDIVSMPLGLQAKNAIVSYVRYIGKVFCPTSLAVLYPLDANGYPLWKVAGCLVLLLAATTAVIIERQKYKFLLTGWFWYLGTLVPVIGLVQVGAQSMADRYMYLPGIGIYIIVAWLAGEAIARLCLPKIVPAAAGAVVLVVLLLITRVQVGYWKDSESLFRHTLDVTTNNYVIYSDYGQVLASKGRWDEGIENVRRAVAINPVWIEGHEKLANVLQGKGLDAEAAVEFELVLQKKPDKIDTRNNFGVALVKSKQYDKAIEQFAMVLTEDPCRMRALNNLYKAGVESGKLDKTLDVILGLQAKDQNNFEFYQKAGLIYGTKGDVNAAIVQLEKACRLSDYKVIEPMLFLSQAYAAKKDMKRAVETAQKALEAAQKENRDDIVAQLRASLESYQKAMKGN